MRAPKNLKSSPGEAVGLKASTPPSEPTPRNRDRNPELEAAFGARIRAARIAAKMSQSALGEVVGISFQQVQKYEKGIDRVSASTLQAFATALGVYPGSFYGDDMPAPTGSIPDVKMAMRIAERIQRIRNPTLVRRLLALIDLLAEADNDQAQRPTNGSGREH